jgi:hypothetical protein
MLQGVALLFLPSDGLVPLHVVSGLFGLFQGGIVPSHALIVRQYFAPAQARARVGTVLMSTLIGMALGGWLSGGSSTELAPTMRPSSMASCGTASTWLSWCS